MMHTWLDEILVNEYTFVKVLKSNENSELIVYRHKQTGINFVKRVFSGKGDVYNILRCILNKHIPRVFEVIEQDGKCEVLEEYIEGVTLADLLKESSYDEKGVRNIVYEICEGLQVIHSKNIVHRDIKPDNIMIDENGIIRIIDYSAARIYKEFQEFDAIILGTVNYAAPEQYGIAQTDNRADIYSLGITMNMLLTREPPSRKMYTGKLKKL